VGGKEEESCWFYGRNGGMVEDGYERTKKKVELKVKLRRV
jgi:hypothetical protein